MTLRGRLGMGALALSLAYGGTGCGGSSSSAVSSNGPVHGTLGMLRGSVTVFAAASLTAAFDDVKAKLESGHPDLAITYSFAGSQALVAQIQNGAPADVIATADTATMQKLVEGGLVDAPESFARNKLEIVVAPGNPKHVTGLGDFARPDLKVVLNDPSVPAGRYGRQALRAQNIRVAPVSLPLDVKSELLAVEEGNADVGIVYITDVTSAGDAVAGVPIPDAENVVATYPIAVVRTAANVVGAEDFVAEIVKGAGRQALLARGFLPP